MSFVDALDFKKDQDTLPPKIQHHFASEKCVHKHTHIYTHTQCLSDRKK